MTELSESSARAEMVGKPLLAIALVVIYGIYVVVQEGVLPPGWPNGTILVVGGVLSAVAIAAYAGTMRMGSKPGIGNALSAVGGLIPYLYSLYVFGYVGVWSIARLFMDGFSVGGLLVGIFGILLGYRILKTFYDITEASGLSER